MEVKEILFFSLACFTIIVTLDIFPDAVDSVISFLKGVLNHGKRDR